MATCQPQPVVQSPAAAPTAGRSVPIGAPLAAGGANFFVCSRSAAGNELLLFDRVDDARALRVIPIDHCTNHTYHYWHVFVPGIQAAETYGFRACGPFEPDRGLRLDPSKLVLDPYGRGVAVPRKYSRKAARLQVDNAATMSCRAISGQIAAVEDRTRNTSGRNIQPVDVL